MYLIHQVIFLARNGLLRVDGEDVTLPIHDDNFILKRVGDYIVRIPII